MATSIEPPSEVRPPPSPRLYWTRRGIAEWLAELVSEDQSSLIGIDHGFSFPMTYFRENHLRHDWTAFLGDFHAHWPTDQDNVYVDFVRDGLCGNATARSGNRRWRRLTEVRAGGAKPVFHFDVQGSVAKSTHARAAVAALFPEGWEGSMLMGNIGSYVTEDVTACPATTSTQFGSVALQPSFRYRARDTKLQARRGAGCALDSARRLEMSILRRKVASSHILSCCQS